MSHVAHERKCTFSHWLVSSLPAQHNAAHTTASACMVSNFVEYAAERPATWQAVAQSSGVLRHAGVSWGGVFLFSNWVTLCMQGWLYVFDSAVVFDANLLAMNRVQCTIPYQVGMHMQL